jgi:Protein of unknown function with PCYCGC motif
MATHALGAALCGTLLLATIGCSDSGPARSRESTATPAPPVVTESRIAADLPMLKANLDMGARPAEVVRQAYEFAARQPDVLKYVPCFCGCERGGHKGNDNCFVAGRDAKGQVTAWDTHGLGCEICIDVAQQAMQMHNSGASLPEIRAAVDKRYAAIAHRTPTPMPPAKGAKGSVH